MGDFGACDAQTALRAVKAAETVAEQARDFMYKPDGGALRRGRGVLCSPTHPPPSCADVSYRMGLKLDQEPAVYSVGTEYLMPGPSGNLYKVPDLPAIRKALMDQAVRATQIWRSVNTPLPPPEVLAQLQELAQARAAAAAPPAAAAAVSAASPSAEEEEEDAEEEEAPRPTQPPRRSGAASLSLSSVGLALSHLGRSLRLPPLGRPRRK